MSENTISVIIATALVLAFAFLTVWLATMQLPEDCADMGVYRVCWEKNDGR